MAELGSVEVDNPALFLSMIAGKKGLGIGLLPSFELLKLLVTW